MTKQLYELEHPLYPHKDLLKYHNDHKIQYVSPQGSYDDAYNEWYQLVRADHDLSGAAKRPIYREISQILRLKSAGKNYLILGETLIGYDHENNPIPFFHSYGRYEKPYFRTVYNYELKRASTIRSGGNETIYFIEYKDPKQMDTLYECGPDDKDIELLVNVGSMQYGGRGIFKYDEFRDLSLEDLGAKGAKNPMFSQRVVPIPAAQAVEQINATTSKTQQDLWSEFQEFQKFKAQSQITQPAIQTDNVNVTTRKVKISPTDDKQ